MLPEGSPEMGPVRRWLILGRRKEESKRQVFVVAASFFASLCFVCCFVLNENRVVEPRDKYGCVLFVNACWLEPGGMVW